MNKQIWVGIIIFFWGIGVTGFGLGMMNPVGDEADFFRFTAPDQEVIFLLAGGIVTCLIGLVGLVRCIGWIPEIDRQSGAPARHFRPRRVRP